MFYQDKGKFRKQAMPINMVADERLNYSPQEDLVYFISSQLRKAVEEKKSIEIEGKLGRFIPKSETDKYECEIQLFTMEVISDQCVVQVKPFRDYIKFKSATHPDLYQDQVKYFDCATESKGDEVFKEYIEIKNILERQTLEKCQNDIVVDFSFQDGTRLKVPLSVDAPVTLDKKEKSPETNLDFILQRRHYRISARQEDEITDKDAINEKLVNVMEGQYSSVRIKHRKAYKYLFMEFAFTRVFSFAKINKSKYNALEQAQQELFEEFKNGPAKKVLSRSIFKALTMKYFQKAFDIKYSDHTNCEAELEIKQIDQFFSNLINFNTPENEAQLKSYIRVFIRNLISLNSASDLFGNFYSESIKIKDSNGNLKPIPLYKPSFLGEYLKQL